VPSAAADQLPSGCGLVRNGSRLVQHATEKGPGKYLASMGVAPILGQASARNPVATGMARMLRPKAWPGVHVASFNTRHPRPMQGRGMDASKGGEGGDARMKHDTEARSLTCMRFA